jgi:hypothetical protein
MKRLAEALVAISVMATAGGASAVVLPADVPTPLPGTTVAMQPHLAGVVLEDVIQAFSFSAFGGTVSGTVQSRVVRSSVDGTLDFYWQVVSDARSAGAIQALRLGNFVTPVYDANWRADGSGDTAPSHARLFSSPSHAVNFIFNNDAIVPGASSYLMFLDTTALTYTNTGVYDVAATGNNGFSEVFATFAPGTPVPEPASAAIFALGAMALTWARRRS